MVKMGSERRKGEEKEVATLAEARQSLPDTGRSRPCFSGSADKQRDGGANVAVGPQRRPSAQFRQGIPRPRSAAFYRILLDFAEFCHIMPDPVVPRPGRLPPLSAGIRRIPPDLVVPRLLVFRSTVNA